MALVITLILLSVITFMAIAFLVLSRTQRSSTSVATQQSIARLAADAALARAQGDVIAQILASGNDASTSLRVSRNYINPLGYQDGIDDVTNVSYTYGNGVPVTGIELQRNINNLLYDPRPPVFIVTNTAQGFPDFRYYLDLNRNGRFEPTGYLAVTNATGQPILDANGLPVAENFIGDPQWIGGLEFPSRHHAPDNQFIYRYAYLVVPSSETLDINYIHNQARNPGKSALDLFGADFNRDQGVGTWELNLASFLYDLNTNTYCWGGQYVYNPFFPQAIGAAFTDAGAILNNRYAGRFNTLAPISFINPVNGATAVTSDGLDTYSAAVPMTTTFNAPADPDLSPYCPNLPWSGADNTNHFFTSVSDLFDPYKVSLPFYNRLMTAGTTNLSSYDRYTYYRLLSQLGTDSAPEQDRINLNYRNVDAWGNIVPGMATNFLAWTPEQFFTNTANKLLKDAGFNFTSANIPVYPTNYYTPSVHRLFQVAANIYDATTKQRTFRQDAPALGFPSVFRPLLVKTPTNIVICGYQEITNSIDLTSLLALDLRDTNTIATLPNGPVNMMAYGVPVVIGARKGFPNFNEFSMLTAVTATRKLEFWKDYSVPTNSPPSQTNQMVIVGITNAFAAELWNSYTNPYPSGLQIYVRADISANLTNRLGLPVGLGPAHLMYTYTLPNTAYGPLSALPGALSGAASFVLPLNVTNWVHMPDAAWRVSLTPEQFEPLPTDVFDQNLSTPHWWLTVRTRLQCELVDTVAHRVVDYVNLDASEDPVDIAAQLMTDYELNVQSGKPGSMWITNGAVAGSSNPGINNQIAASRGSVTVNWGQVKNYKYQVDSFRYNFNGEGAIYGNTISQRTNHFFAPYTPTRTVYFGTSWQANDPLVHYTIGDLIDPVHTNRVAVDKMPDNVNPLGNLRMVNTRYQPWPIDINKTGVFQRQDPLVTRSDDWDFPTNKFANIGWLGRVHRGTPWQTIYLKSAPMNLPEWQSWCGNYRGFVNDGRFDTSRVPLNNLVVDAALTSPTNDWSLLDLFTTTINQNAAKGKLSVNQSGLAAWSAALGGVVVLSNATTEAEFELNPFRAPVLVPLLVNPAGVYDTNAPPPLARMVNAINRTRSAANGKRAFQKLGDILSVPELTVGSPFLNTSGDLVLSRGISDAAYERIPQQVLGLLKCDHTPRFVVYSYGQALKPANKSKVTSGPFSGLCTNYQVTAEVATRAVIRVDGGTTKPHAVIESFNLLGPD